MPGLLLVWNTKSPWKQKHEDIIYEMKRKKCIVNRIIKTILFIAYITLSIASLFWVSFELGKTGLAELLVYPVCILILLCYIGLDFLFPSDASFVKVTHRNNKY